MRVYTECLTTHNLGSALALVRMPIDVTSQIEAPPAFLNNLSSETASSSLSRVRLVRTLYLCMCVCVHMCVWGGGVWVCVCVCGCGCVCGWVWVCVCGGSAD